jgi:hypothetical protein
MMVIQKLKPEICVLKTYLCTHSLIPWNRGFPEKLTGPPLVRKFPTFYGT